MVEFKFHMRMPIFIARQWIRHRTANVNEYSGRYSVMPDLFFRPERETIAMQSKSNRQGRAEPVSDELAAEVYELLDARRGSLRKVQKLWKRQVFHAKSSASPYRWVCILSGTGSATCTTFSHFLGLRMDPHAQQEIRDYAKRHVCTHPAHRTSGCSSLLNYQLDSMQLSQLEVEVLANGEPLNSKTVVSKMNGLRSE